MELKKEKISGLLNNCAMNCALPILLEDIAKYARLESNKNLPNQEKDKIFRNLCKLKETFCTTYGLNNGEITWNKFNDFLTKHPTFLAKEILFLPVFRDFIDWSYGHTSEETKELYFEINKDTIKTYSDNGRYHKLEPAEAFYLFYEKFGINLEVYLFNDNKGNFIPAGVHLKCEKSDSKRSVTMYFKEGHYEINPEKFSKQQSDEETFLEGDIKCIWQGFSDTADTDNTKQYMNSLKHYVRRELDASYKDTVEYTENEQLLKVLQASQDTGYHQHIPPKQLMQKNILEPDKEEGRGTEVYTSVHEGSSTASTKQDTLAVKFPKKSNKSNHSFLFQLFTNTYFQITMAVVFSVSLFIILILATSGGPLSAAATTVAYKAVFGSSISGAATSGPALLTSWLAELGIFNDGAEKKDLEIAEVENTNTP